MNTTKNGKKPLATRPPQSVDIQADELFGNACSISPELARELDEKGLVPRFVDAKKLYEMNGYHPKGWVPYKRDMSIVGKEDFKYGSDPSGIIRRGSLILAVKTKEQAAKHKAYLDQRAGRAKTFNTEKAKELRDFGRSHNLPVEVHEGYEENDGE